MILSEWRLNIHFFSVHCNLLNVDTPKEQFSGPFLTSLKKKYPLIHLLCFLTAIKLIIHIYHTFTGAQWHTVYKPLDNKVLFFFFQTIFFALVWVRSVRKDLLIMKLCYRELICQSLGPSFYWGFTIYIWKSKGISCVLADMWRISVEGERATLECLQGGLCVFQRNLVFLPSGSECKIVQTITFLQGMFLTSFLVILFYEKEFIINWCT